MSSRGWAGWPLARVCEWSLIPGFRVWVFPCGHQKKAWPLHGPDAFPACSRVCFLQTLCWWPGWFRFRCQTVSLWTGLSVERFCQRARLLPCCSGHCRRPGSPQNYCLSGEIKQVEPKTLEQMQEWTKKAKISGKTKQVGFALPLCWPPSLGWCFLSGQEARS